MTKRSEPARKLLTTKRQKELQDAFFSGAATAIRIISTTYGLDAQELRVDFSNELSKEAELTGAELN